MNSNSQTEQQQHDSANEPAAGACPFFCSTLAAASSSSSQFSSESESSASPSPSLSASCTATSSPPSAVASPKASSEGSGTSLLGTAGGAGPLRGIMDDSVRSADSEESSGAAAAIASAAGFRWFRARQPPAPFIKQAVPSRSDACTTASMLKRVSGQHMQ